MKEKEPIEIKSLTIKDRLRGLLPAIRRKRDDWPKTRIISQHSRDGIFRETTGKSLNEHILGDDSQF